MGQSDKEFKIIVFRIFKDITDDILFITLEEKLMKKWAEIKQIYMDIMQHVFKKEISRKSCLIKYFH